MNLASIREAKGLSRSELAKMVNVTLATVTRWENGNRHPDVLCAVKIANVLGCTLDDLLRTEPNPTLPPAKAQGEPAE